MQNSANAKLKTEAFANKNEGFSILVYSFICSEFHDLLSPPSASVSDTQNYLQRGQHSKNNIKTLQWVINPSHNTWKSGLWW